mgnify:CR=1 FL=1
MTAPLGFFSGAPVAQKKCATAGFALRVNLAAQSCATALFAVAHERSKLGFPQRAIRSNGAMLQCSEMETLK